MKFDLVTLYPMHRRCITLISSLLTLSGWVRKPLNYLKVRTGMYRYILLRTNMEFLYCPVPSRTGTYWYVPVRTILPNPVQGYRIPDDRIITIITIIAIMFVRTTAFTPFMSVWLLLICYMKYIHRHTCQPYGSKNHHRYNVGAPPFCPTPSQHVREAPS